MYVLLFYVLFRLCAQVDLRCVQDRMRSKDAQNTELRGQLEQQGARARTREVEHARVQAEMAQVGRRFEVSCVEMFKRKISNDDTR